MRIMIAAAIAAVAIPAVPAMAQSPNQEYRNEVRDAQRDYNRRIANADSPRDVAEARREYNEDVRDAQQDYRRDRRERRTWRGDWRQYRNYDYNRLPRGESAYWADDYYRDGRYYRERRLTRNDRIYRGRDGRYYCRRSDGTTGLVIGAVAGGLFGNAISNGRNSTIGTLLGAAVGASVGASIDRGQVRCR
jgi:uncharacterized protein YcfJ